MIAGHTISSLDKMRDYYQFECNIKMKDSTHFLSEEIIQLFDIEQKLISEDVRQRPVSLIYDAKHKFGREMFGTVARYIDKNFQLKQRLLDIQILNESLDNEKMSACSIKSVSEKGILCKNVIGSMCDRSSVNSKARKEFLQGFMKIVFFLNVYLTLHQIQERK